MRPSKPFVSWEARFPADFWGDRGTLAVDRAHGLGEVDDDGNRDPFFRRYRYVCRCGKAGAWRDSVQLARGEHAVHRLDDQEAA